MSFILVTILSFVAATTAQTSTSVQCDAVYGLNFSTLEPIVALPDPFLFTSGQNVTTAAEWNCRRQEIGSLFQQYELGTLPPMPSSMNASFASSNLTINCADGGNSISFTVPITYPNSSSANPPYPAMITFGPPTSPIPSDLAVIVFNNSAMAAQDNLTSRGMGQFFDLYGSNASASAMMAWSWGVSRIIDALEMTNATNIDTTKLGVTGCSRDGKGALVAGAFDDRIALTVPQESGSGGDTCWRLSDAEHDAGNIVQTLAEIVTENVWFSAEFENFVNKTDLLPMDHHMLAGMIAPRGLISFENTGYEWLSPMSSFGCMTAAQRIYQALGVPDNIGFSQDGNHSHCQFPAEQQPDLTSFINRFLLGQNTTNTTIFKSQQTFNASQWINWPVPSFQ